MGTMIRPEISINNPYWINRHRYYELKHFCLQYPIWNELYRARDGLRKYQYREYVQGGDISDPTISAVIDRELYSKHMRLLEEVAKQTDESLANYILSAVTNGDSYTKLKTQYDIPCGKDMYYDRYRKFFWLLDKLRL